jgi:hypothetical protein
MTIIHVGEYVCMYVYMEMLEYVNTCYYMLTYLNRFDWLLLYVSRC